MPHLLLSGGYANTPDAALLDITGDFDLRCRCALDDWDGAGQQSLVGKFGGVQRSYLLYVGTGSVLTLGWSTDGTAGTQVLESSTDNLLNVGVTDGQVVWVRATLDVDNGAGGYEVDFYFSTDDVSDPGSVSWTQLGSTKTGGATTSVHSGSNPLTLGAVAGGGGAAAGEFYRVAVYDGIAGTLVFDGDPSDTATWNCPDKESFAEKANDATVTLQGDAELVGDCPTTGNGNRMGSGAIRRKGGARH